MLDNGEEQRALAREEGIVRGIGHQRAHTAIGFQRVMEQAYMLSFQMESMIVCETRSERLVIKILRL